MKQKGINVATVDFERDMTDLINSCTLPASTIRLVMAKLLDEVTRIERDIIEKERAEYEQQDEVTDDGD